jgi:hypothetical protein
MAAKGAIRAATIEVLVNFRRGDSHAGIVPFRFVDAAGIAVGAIASYFCCSATQRKEVIQCLIVFICGQIAGLSPLCGILSHSDNLRSYPAAV